MEMQIFTVYDSAAGAYLQPFFAPSIEFAIREFRSAVNSPDHQFAKYPEDYTLFHVGAFDQASAIFMTQEPHSLGVAITFVRSRFDEMVDAGAVPGAYGSEDLKERIDDA